MRRIGLAAAVLVALLVGTGSAQAQERLSYRDGRAAIITYSKVWSAKKFSLIRCQRRDAISVACLLLWHHLEAGEWVNPDGTTEPQYADFAFWTVAVQRRDCLKVWQPEFRNIYARCVAG